MLSLGYRLAPEHPWPAAVNDTVAGIVWARETLRPAWLAVGGDSAGGTLATLACLRLREERPGLMPDLQLLLCPNTDLTGSHPSMREKGTGYGLTAEGVRAFNRNWVPNPERWGDPGVSPLHAPDLSGLPPAIVITAEHDPLRDEAEAYAGRLTEAGVPVLARREAGLEHGFIMMDLAAPECAAAGDRVAGDLRSGAPARG